MSHHARTFRQIIPQITLTPHLNPILHPSTKRFFLRWWFIDSNTMTGSLDNEGLVVAVQYVCGQSSICRVQKPLGFIGCAVAMVRHKCCWNFFLARQITKTSTLFIVAPFNQGAAEITNIPNLFKTWTKKGKHFEQEQLFLETKTIPQLEGLDGNNKEGEKEPRQKKRE